MSKYISEVIGENYKSWGSGDSILISSQTGSGKSSFVLHTLLPQAIAENKHIVYICNRRVLKEQFSILSQKELKKFFGVDDIPDKSFQYIHIVTYQYCEIAKQLPDLSIPPNLKGISRKERLTKPSQLPQAIKINRNDIMYYIFDEAHYFISDATFNSNTNYWFGKWSEYSMERVDKSICVFLTATPEPLMCFLAYRQSKNWFDLQKIYEKLEERAKLRKYLEEQTHLSVDMKAGTNRIEINSMRYINDECRKIQPYKNPISQLKEFIQAGSKSSPHYFYYTSPHDYSYATPVYFSEYSQLIELILDSQEKWLIFVDRERDGIYLSESLNQRDTTAVFLSAKTSRSSKYEGYYEFHNIVDKQRFNCKVLIATAVLDCGINIVDSAVKNIVISHPEKTTFMQMLGRKRINDGESINLYIKLFDPKTINALRYKCEEKIQFIIYFSLRNNIDYDRIKMPTADDDGMMPHSKLTAESLNQIIQLLPMNSNLIWNPAPVAAPTIGPYTDVNKYNVRGFSKEYDYSKTALISLLYSFSNYQEAVDIHRNTQDPAFYIKLQLDWIGKTYNEACWLGYQSSIDAMTQYLGEYVGLSLNKQQQKDFILGFLHFLESHPVPNSKIGKICSAYIKNHEKLPGKKSLNDIFQILKMPYIIRSKQTSGKFRQAHWLICLQG